MTNDNLRRKATALFIFSALTGFFQLASAQSSNVEVVKNLEVDRYVGKWYDVRSIPNDFQKGCTNTTAEYTAEPAGTLKVKNACRVVDENGQFVKDDTAEGRAWVKNEDNSILKVSFACILDVCLEAAAGDYYVLALGPVNGDGLYAWALVGEPNREFGWILSRTKALPARVMTEIEKKIVDQGYNPANFNMTHQD